MENAEKINSEVVNRILFGSEEGQRFTQETPILPEVWQLYASDPGERRDLLITPMEDISAVELLRTLLDNLGTSFDLAEAAPLQSFLAARLSFDELVRQILPLTDWACDAKEHYSAWRDRHGGRQVQGFEAFDLVYRNAGGTRQGPPPTEPPQGRPEEPLVLRGGVFEAMRILTLVAAIKVVELLPNALIQEVDQLFDLRDEIAGMIDALAQNFLHRDVCKPQVWRVASNRRIRKTDEYSRATVKADAAFRLFEVKCEKITWAVIDSGIDRDHPAFVIPPSDPPKPGEEQGVRRVVATYNLGILRSLLNAAYRRAPERNPVLQTCIRDSGLSEAEALGYLTKAYQSYQTNMLDWSSIEPLLKMNDPPVPIDGHGTHVAGIIGADWRSNRPPVVGMCPDIRLMDLRILGENSDESEFAVIGALQLVRYLNSHNQYIVVHGVNLSLAIPHMVENYACGRTPVCDECERLVGAGVTVVAAAGNSGYQKFNTQKGIFSSYATLSITDPGNAESVITVGSTHRREPHTYGISYFSSRGPTGDGRLKPDLVAPGERIVSTLPDVEYGPLDGTSQAAPHVSAAAAMLMARYPELDRQPRRIKQILCESATDLGRERAFQGHGLLDILRALQSF